MTKLKPNQLFAWKMTLPTTRKENQDITNLFIFKMTILTKSTPKNVRWSQEHVISFRSWSHRVRQPLLPNAAASNRQTYNDDDDVTAGQNQLTAFYIKINSLSLMVLLTIVLWHYILTFCQSIYVKALGFLGFLWHNNITDFHTINKKFFYKRNK